MFDKSFILDRINECQKLITFRINRDDSALSDVDFDFLDRCLDSYGYWLKCAASDDSFSESESSLLAADFFHFSTLVLCAHDGDSDEQVIQVLESTSSTQLPVLRLLGQRFTTYPLRNKCKPVSVPTRHWFMPPESANFTKQLLSNSRPVGGLA